MSQAESPPPLVWYRGTVQPMSNFDIRPTVRCKSGERALGAGVNEGTGGLENKLERPKPISPQKLVS